MFYDSQAAPNTQTTGKIKNKAGDVNYNNNTNNNNKSNNNNKNYNINNNEDSSDKL